MQHSTDFAHRDRDASVIASLVANDSSLPLRSVERLPGGRNGRTYAVEIADRSEFVVKFYRVD